MIIFKEFKRSGCLFFKPETVRERTGEVHVFRKSSFASGKLPSLDAIRFIKPVNNPESTNASIFDNVSKKSEKTSSWNVAYVALCIFPEIKILARTPVYLPS